MLYLVEPTIEMEKQIIAYREAYITAGEETINGSCRLIQYSQVDQWLELVDAARRAETSYNHVPATTYLTIRKEDGKIVGTVQLRHELNEDLSQRGGHIGYGISPNERNKGYGVEQLELILEKARELHIPKVLITCNSDNLASASVAKKCGGILTWEGEDTEDGFIQHYWITL